MDWLTLFVLASFFGFEIMNKMPSTIFTPLDAESNAIGRAARAPVCVVRPALRALMAALERA